MDGTTYRVVGFVAPVNGCFIKEIWLSGSVKAAGGTSTIAVDNFDASANATGNVLSTGDIDPTSVPTTILEGEKLTLNTTAGNLVMDEGDVLNSTYVTGTQTTNGEGYALTAIIIVPVIL